MQPAPIPTLRCSRPGPDHVPTCLSNGVVGVTPGLNPLLLARTLVGGFVSSHPSYGIETLALSPYPLGLDIAAGGRHMRANAGAVAFLDQTLSMENGELVTRLAFLPESAERLSIAILQFASRSVPCLLCQEVRISCQREQEIQIVTSIDTDGTRGSVFTDDTDAFTRGWYAEDLVDRCMGFATDRSRLGLATVVVRDPALRKTGRGTYSVHVRAGETVAVKTIAALVSDAYSPDPHLEAIRMARWGEMLGFETLRHDNRDAWSELWKSRIVIIGASDDQKGLDAAFYYYHASIHPSSIGGIPPFGLAQDDKYFGHNFWDTDIWMFIPALLTAPRSARAIASYRVRGLHAARRKAQLYGFRGAQFPWEASLDGWEATPSCCPTGWAEQHVTPGVALGIWEYQRACGDSETLRDIAWPVLKDVANWIESRGRMTTRGFEVAHMMGPDEGITNLSNQTYFNLLSKLAMEAAIECARLMRLTPPSSWDRIRSSIVIPTDEATGAVLPFDRESTARIFNPALQVFEEGPAPLTGEGYSLGNLQFLFLHGAPVDEKVFRATWLQEEKLRLARFPTGGVPSAANIPGFTTGPFAVCAAHFGEREKAAELFTAAWKPFWIEPFGMTRESQSHTWGGFVTNNGSLLQSVLLGFTGLRIGDGVRPAYPAALPKGWEGITIQRIWSRGRPMRLTATHGKKAVLSLQPEG